MEYNADAARPLCIEAALSALRDKLPEDVRSEVDQVIAALDNRDGDLEALISDYTNRV